MIDFSSWLDLPLIWGLLIATVLFLYVVLDGFDLGCGILFPFAPSDKCRSRMMNSIAPFWDGNETWLVLGGGGLLVAFPLAYAILLPAFYLPIILMLFGLIFRGVAFEFRFKATKDRQRRIWDTSFHAGSLLTAFMQGMIVGSFIQGVEVDGREFSGGPFDWATGFSMFTGIAWVFGYALLGATWLIMKTEDKTQEWARNVARYVLGFVLVGMFIVSVAMPIMDARIADLWFSLPNFFFVAPVPFLALVVAYYLLRVIREGRREITPFLLTLGLFLLSYIGFGISLYPWIVPFSYDLWEAAAVSTSLSFTLIGVVFTLPLILFYTGFCYYIFRGKSNDEAMY